MGTAAETKKATIKVRIVKGTLELPHTISKKGQTYEFTPDAELPEALGLALIATNPSIYEAAKGKPNLEDYTFKKTFQVQEVQKVLSELTEEELTEVYDYAKKVIADRKPVKPATKPETGGTGPGSQE